MFKSIKNWLKNRSAKKDLEKSLAQEIREVLAYDWYGALKELKGRKNFQTAMKELEIRYFKLGLSRKDIDKVIKKEKRGSLRLE